LSSSPWKQNSNSLARLIVQEFSILCPSSPLRRASCDRTLLCHCLPPRDVSVSLHRPDRRQRPRYGPGERQDQQPPPRSACVWPPSPGSMSVPALMLLLARSPRQSASSTPLRGSTSPPLSSLRLRLRSSQVLDPRRHGRPHGRLPPPSGRRGPAHQDPGEEYIGPLSGFWWFK
jgi:hypothetical protein